MRSLSRLGRPDIQMLPGEGAPPDRLRGEGGLPRQQVLGELDQVAKLEARILQVQQPREEHVPRHSSEGLDDEHLPPLFRVRVCHGREGNP